MKFLTRCFAIALLAVSLAAPPSQAVEIDEALRDEMQRSMEKLQLAGHPRPHFISYTMRENQYHLIGSYFGALIPVKDSRDRQLAVDLRIGDTKLDNSKYDDSTYSLFSGSNRRRGGYVTPENNYDALRFDTWMATDRAYKRAVEDLESKKVYLKQTTVADRPDEMTKETPVTSIEKPLELVNNDARWKPVIKKLSAIFKEYPEVEMSSVFMLAQVDNRWFVNTEGSRISSGQAGVYLVSLAAIRGVDNSVYSDALVFGAKTEAELPPPNEIEKAERLMMQNLIALSKAPPAEEYSGPVLFEAEAAADLFSELLPQNLSSPHDSNYTDRSSSRSNAWKEKIGSQVASKIMTVTDDPTAKEYKGKPLLGGWDIDDDGVRAQKITLIENGVLKTMCMSRIPTHTIKQSNGHSMGGYGATSILFIDSSNTMSSEALRKKLIDMGKEEGLKEVLVVKRLCNMFSFVFNSKGFSNAMKSTYTGSSYDGAMVLPPLMVYKLNVEDGTEKLIRGPLFINPSLRWLKQIIATGDDTSAHNVVMGSMGPVSIVNPSVILRDIEIGKPPRETDKPMLLKNPYFEENASK
jgi:predicted Zn-dependent protease